MPWSTEAQIGIQYIPLGHDFALKISPGLKIFLAALPPPPALAHPQAGMVLGTSTVSAPVAPHSISSGSADNLVSQATLNSELAAWMLAVQGLVQGNTGYVSNPQVAAGGYSGGGTLNNFALSQKIDQLSGTAISGAAITGSTIDGYLPLSGGTLTGSFALSSQSAGCAQFDAGGALTSTGVSCGTGGGGSAFSTTSAAYFLSVNQGASFSTTSAQYFLSQNPSSTFSTTSAQYWQSVTDLFSTTSASYFLSQNPSSSFSTTSAEYWRALTNFFSTTSASYFVSQNQGAAFSTTSANYHLASFDKGYFFSTTSASYFSGASGLLSSTSIQAQAPLSFNTATGAFTITQSGTGQSGYLSSADFNMFTNKISSTSLSAGGGIAYNSSTGLITNTIGYGFAGNATTTAIAFNGGLTANTGTITTLSATNILAAGSTTLQNFTGINATTTNATTTTLAITGVSGQLLKTLSNGAVVAAVAGQDYLTAATTFAFPFAGGTDYGSTVNATSTLWFTGGLFASSTSHFANADFINSTSTNSTSTNMYSSSLIAGNATTTSFFATTASSTNLFASALAVGGNGLVYSGGNVGISTSTPWSRLSVTGTVASPQFTLAYDQTRYAQLQVNSVGDMLISATGGNVRENDGNFFACSGGACPTPTVAISGTGNLQVENRLIAGSIEETCPSGYIWVPGEAKYGTNPGFCTMKYDASNDGSSNAVSNPANAPWVSISQTSAIAQCQAIGPGYHLMSEPEWMTIADEMSALPINDIDAAAGLQLATGQSDNAPANALSEGDAGTDPVVSGCNLMKPLSDASNAYVASSCEQRGNGSGGSTDADKGYYGTGNQWSSSGYVSGASNKSQLRTFVLPSGAIIWDMAGNVWQWTDQTMIFATEVASSTVALNNWAEYNTITNYHALSYARPQQTTWTAASNGIGEMYIGTPSGGISAFVRGGGWAGGSLAGVFALLLGNAPSSTYSNVGFRCSR